jgi:tetratricopeptide (TPR) repeat protein
MGRKSLLLLVQLCCVCAIWRTAFVIATTTTGAPDADASGDPTPAQLRKQGDTAILSGNFRDALALYGRLIDAEPAKAANWYKRASVNIRLKKYKRAMPDLDQALALDETYEKGLLYRGKAGVLLGECDAALTDLTMLMKSHPKNKKGTALMDLARKCAQQMPAVRRALDSPTYDNCRMGGVMGAFDVLVGIATHSHTILLGQARCHLALGMYQDVVIGTRAILNLDRQNLDVLLLRGLGFEGMRSFDHALSHYKEGLRSDPEHKAIKKQYKALKKLTRRMSSADELREGGKFSEAAEDYWTVINDLAPQNKGVHEDMYFHLCECYLKLHEGEKAVDACTKAYDINPQREELLLRRAQANIEAELFQAAINDYNKILEHSRNHHEARQGKANAENLLKMSLRKNYYKILGVDKRADARAIKKAYRKLTLKYHPDKNQGSKGEFTPEEAEDLFKDLGEAYEVLGDEEKKKIYDSGGDPFDKNQNGGQRGGNPFGNGFNPFGGQQQQQRGGQGGGNFKFNYGGRR